MSRFLIVGLGNIGPEYAQTRHNIGFDIVDSFVIKHGGSFRSGRLADVAECRWKGKTFIVIKPTTYMNLSGKAVLAAVNFYQLTPADIMIVLDDLALPCGKLRIRPGGSDGN